MRRKALVSALSARYREGAVWVIDRLGFERPRTKDAVAVLGKLSCPEKTLVVVSPEEYEMRVVRSFTNIPGVACVRADALTPYTVLLHQGMLLTTGAVQALARRLGDG
ncbi:50S ribosomal protein L4 [Candidatus Bipolaricaulota bacterium]|nr:50S ribosomal protein L4 [Candidatus Bipolaricaulota bacterium]